MTESCAAEGDTCGHHDYLHMESSLLFTRPGAGIKQSLREYQKRYSGDGQAHLEVPAPIPLAYYTGIKETFTVSDSLFITWSICYSSSPALSSVNHRVIHQRACELVEEGDEHTLLHVKEE